MMAKRPMIIAAGIVTVLVASLAASTVASNSANAESTAATAAPVSPHPLTLNGAYTFTNAATGATMAMSNEILSGPVMLSKTAMPVYKNIQLKALQNGDVQLSSVASGLCLTPTASGAVNTQPCGATNQTFTAITYGPTYLWLNRATNLVLAADGNALVMRSRDNGAAQRWGAGAGTQNRIAVNARGLAGGGTAFAANTTLRLTANLSASGDRVRFQISNKYGKGDLHIGAASIAIQSSGSVPTATPVAATFGGATTVTIPMGAEIYTDPLALTVSAGQSALVSIHLPQATAATSYHNYGFSTTYIADAANSVMATNSAAFNRSTTQAFVLKGIDVSSATTKKSLVALGDSITDGYLSGVDLNQRWPDKLAERMRATGAPAASVVNAGIASNRIMLDLADGGGYSAITRFDSDVVQRQGVTGVFIFEGINDIAGDRTTAEMIAGLTNLVTQARKTDLAVNISTISPFGGVSSWTPAREQVRTEVNAWIRANSIGADYVADFDLALRDPNAPTRLLAAYNSGDHVHPNAAGFSAMANSINLSALRY